MDTQGVAQSLPGWRVYVLEEREPFGDGYRPVLVFASGDHGVDRERAVKWFDAVLRQRHGGTVAAVKRGGERLLEHQRPGQRFVWKYRVREVEP